MEQEYHTIRHDRLLASTAYVPEASRAAFFATLMVGAESVPELEEVEVADDVAEPASFPLTVEQARKLRDKIDPNTWAILKKAVTNPQDNVGTISWPDIKILTAVSNWPQFAQGRLGGLHRAMQKIDGVPKGAVLLWECDGWVGDGNGDYSAGLMAIDGPAVITLRTVCGLTA